jgi:hypothetical protein
MLAEVDGQNVTGSNGAPAAVISASFDFVFLCLSMLAGKSRPDLLAPSTDELPGPGSVHPSESGPRPRVWSG